MCLLTFLLPVFSLLPRLPICKWHFLGWEGGPGPQVCVLSLPGRGPSQSEADACGACPGGRDTRPGVWLKAPLCVFGAVCLGGSSPLISRYFYFGKTLSPVWGSCASEGNEVV